MKLFTYGTLKRGFHNHYLLKGAEFLREDTVQGTLFTSSPDGAGIPFLLPGVGTVTGEVFEVPENLLPRLDALEGHPRWYTRERTKSGSGGEVEVYMYRHASDQLYSAPSGTYGIRK